MFSSCDRCGGSNQQEARFCQSCGSPLTPTDADLRVARRTVTIVFCDLVESTSLGESLDPEMLRNVITRYFEEMQRILISYEGTVEKFIGDAVMGAFGIPILHEDDALRAVTAAIDMQRSIDTLNNDLRTQRGLRLQVRIGVNTGEVVSGDPSTSHGFVSGDPVNIAARLQQQAGPGEILIGEQTYQLTRDAIESEDLGPIELKGKAQSMLAYRVRDIRKGSLGRWRRLDSPLVGRTEELGALNESFTLTLEQEAPILVSLLGQPGVGKTRLTRQFLCEVTDRAHVLKAHFLPYGQTGSLRPIGEAIEEYCGIGDSDSETEIERKLTAVVPDDPDEDLIVSRLMSLLGRAPEAPDVQDIFWAIRRFCEAIADNRPLVLSLDDLHWADATVLDLVEYLTAFARASILILSTARPTLRDDRPSWGQGHREVVLDRLDDAEVIQLCRSLTEGCDLPYGLEQRIVDMAEGNPLFVEELVRALIDAELLERTPDGLNVVGDVSDLQIPPTIGALIAARLDRLSDEERTVLERASVIGPSFWWKSLNVVLPEDLQSGAGRHLNALMQKELIEPDLSLASGEDAFRFKHAAVRRVAYGGLSKELRSRLHEKAAGWLAGNGSATTEDLVAYHYEQAVLLRRDLGSDPEQTEVMAQKAASLLEAAGLRSLNSSDVAAAITALRRSIDLLPDDRKRGELCIDLVGALLEGGDLTEAKETIDLVLDRPYCEEGGSLWARAELQRRALLDYVGADETAMSALPTLEELASIFESEGDRLWLSRAEYQQAYIHWDAYELGQTEIALNRALACARQADSPHDVSRALGSMTAILLLGPQPVEEAILRCEEIIDLPESSLLVKGKSMLRLAGLKAMKEDFTEARRLIANGRSLLSDLGHNFALAASSHEAGMVEVFAQSYDSAEKEFRRGIRQLKAMDEKATFASSAAFLARTLYALGRFKEALEWSWTSEAAWDGNSLGIVEWGPTRAKLMARSGDLDEAKTMALAALKPVSESDDILARTHALLGVADVYLIAENKLAAIPYLEEALALYRKKGILSMEKSVLQKLDAAAAA